MPKTEHPTRTTAGKVRWCLSKWDVSSWGDKSSPLDVAAAVARNFYPHIADADGRYRVELAVQIPNVKEVAAAMRSIAKGQAQAYRAAQKKEPPPPYYAGY